MMLGGALTKVDCLGKTIAQVQAAVKARRAEQPDAKMVLGCQFQYDALGGMPHKKYLDAVCPDVPVIIDDSSLHSSWVNSAALEAMGITAATPNPQGGEWVRDESGELTGYVKETAVMDTVWPFLVRETSGGERAAMLARVFDAYLATGVTGAVDLATVPEDLAALEACAAAGGGRLPIRIACHWLMRPNGTREARLEQVRTAAAHRDRLAPLAPWLSMAGIKIISDGVIDSCTAYLSEPYPNGATPGPIWPSDELAEVVTLADALGLQVACHAIGDAAVAQALDVFEAAAEANGPKERRHRIEHLELVSEDSIRRLARAGVIASMQPVHADPVKVVNWCDVLEHDHRCDRMFPWREFEDERANVAFGSDAPTAPYHPLPNMYTATTHKSAIDPARPDPATEREKNLARLCVSVSEPFRWRLLTPTSSRPRSSTTPPAPRTRCAPTSTRARSRPARAPTFASSISTRGRRASTRCARPRGPSQRPGSPASAYGRRLEQEECLRLRAPCVCAVQ